MLWTLIAVMLAAAILFVAAPLYQVQKSLSTTLVAAILTVTVLSGLLYSRIGTPGADSVASEQQVPDIDEMVTSLAARLAENPNDLSGWKMLGRSYFNLRDFPGAINAFQKAVELEGAQDGQTLTDLGEAVLYSDQNAITGRAGQLFENALALSPNNPKALFYGGMAAIQRGDKYLGAERWEALLATSPPPNVQEILRAQIAELRGENPAPVFPDATDGLSVNVTLGDAALAANLPDSTVFIIARDPAQPSPPIAAVRIRLTELPTEISISDADAMIPGRVPSGFDLLEIIGRVSLAGQPVAASGDWFGDAIIDTSDTDSVQIVIDRQVP
jgi:cytochrome c-type biogenesis protein CcmH